MIFQYIEDRERDGLWMTQGKKDRLIGGEEGASGKMPLYWGVALRSSLRAEIYDSLLESHR